MYKIYADGSCEPNPGFGGGGDSQSTNNRMECLAIYHGIQQLKWLTDSGNLPKSQNITVYSDSKLALNCTAGTWKRNKNLDIWEAVNKLFAEMTEYQITYQWVKGHSGIKFNEICDQLAMNYSKLLEEELKTKNSRPKYSHNSNFDFPTTGKNEWPSSSIAGLIRKKC